MSNPPVTGQLYQQRGEAGYFEAVFMVNTTTEALPESPLQPPILESVSMVPAMVLTDVTGAPLGTSGNPLATTANVSLVVGNVSVSTGGLVNQAPQSYTNGVTAPLQLDKNGYLKVNVEVANTLTGTFTLNAPIPTGSNTIGNVGIVSTPSFQTVSNVVVVNSTSTSVILNTAGFSTFSLNNPITSTLTATKLEIYGSIDGTTYTYINCFIANQPYTQGSAVISPFNIVGSCAGYKYVQAIFTTVSNSASISLVASTASFVSPTQYIATAAGQPISASVYTSTSSIQVHPTITATTYSTGQVVGGLLTFANALRSPTLSGVVQSLSVVSKSVQTNTYNFYLFSQNPTNTSWADDSYISINPADLPYLTAVFSIPAGVSDLGTMTISTLDNIGKAVVGTSTSLYGVLVATGTPTYSSTSDLYINLQVLKD